MKKRWLVLAVLILISAIVPATSAYALLQNLADPGPMPDAATRISMLQDGQDVDEPAVYFVIFDDAPLASYRGGIVGLAPTNPSALGQVKLDPNSAASIAYLNYLATEQTAFETAMNSTLGRTVEVVGRFQYAINGIAIYATQAEADTIASLTAVTQVTREQVRQLETDAGPEWIGAPGLWDGTNTGGLSGTKGEGLIAGIIDSGVNSDHPSFAEVGPVDAYVHLNPYDDANPATNDYVGACNVIGTAVVCNDKLIGMYDCMSGTGTGIGCPQTLVSNPEDDNGHGSHTASTVAGNEVDALLTAPTTSFTRRISGVAPHANLITYKACIPTGNCVTLNTVSAIEQATIDLVDVINYSIGGSSSDPWSDSDALAYLGARDAGIFVATSAGNSGPDAATIGSPADAPWLMSVAASTHNRTYGNSLINMSGGDTTPPPDINGRSITTDTISAPIVYAGDGAFGNALCAEGTAEAPVNPFPPNYFTGQIVVCDRGTFARTVKGDHVLAAGAIGMILANDEASGESLNADPHSLPAVHISYADGVILKNWLKDGGTGHTGKIAGSALDLASSNGDVIASFSSRGQNPANSNFIKPDVAAPGVDVYAAVHSPPGSMIDEYSFLSGTSMASPHAAGAGVLLRALQPTWTPAEIQSALMTTAHSSMVKEDTITSADPFDMGAGRVDLTVAAKAGFVMDEQEPDYTDADPSTGGDPTTLNIPSLANNFCVSSCSWTRVLSSTQASTVTWTASYSGDPLLSTSASPSFAPDSFTLAAGASKSISITVTIDPAALPDQWLFGTLILTPDDGNIPTAHMPIAVMPRTAASHATTGWTVIKFPTPQPGCTGVGLNGPIIYDNLDCGFGYVGVTNTADGDVVKFDFIHAKTGVVYESGQVGTWRTDDSAWQFQIEPGNTTNPPTWPPGEYYIRVAEVNGYQDNFGQFSIFINKLSADVTAPAGGTNYSPGDAINVTGVINKLDQAAATTTIETPAAGASGANYFLRLVQPDGTAIYTSTQQTASNVDGTFSFTIPAGTTSGVNPGVDEGFRRNLAIQLFDVTWNDGLHDWASVGNAGATNVNIVVEPTGGDEGSVTVQASFVSSVGWVKPDETYPFSVIVRNFSADPIANVDVTIADVDGSNYTDILTPPAGTTASIISAGDMTTVNWTIPTMAANSSLTLVVQARADNLIEDATIVWKDISSTASMTYTGADLGDPNLVSTAHGPKVIPVNGAYNSARYGDRPFPVVQVDYFDRKHQPENTGGLLSDKINSPSIVGSTFNLFQENSFGQLYPNGTHPSSDIAQADFSVDWNGYYDTAGDGSPGSGDDQFFFTTLDPQGTCTGVSNAALAGTGAYADRVVDGRYQMPGTTGYYGQDKYGTAVAAAVGGVGALMAIDDACGPTGKAVYDAAHIADPEIDYNDYDTDKDGIVDFFMMMFVGCGGNGASQLGPAGCDIGTGEPYDNIWPHSSSLLYYYTDPATGLTGYISDDQLKSLTDVPQCWLDNTYAQADDCAANGGSGDDSLPVYVRVGPYNVNPETAIENASVISHEYGHSLGLPDFYSLGGRETYGSWNLMASDHSQNMDVFGKQEMGWIVPVPLGPDETTAVTNWRDSKFDTGEIHWETPDGTPYTLSTANGNQNIHNGEAYNVKLPTPLLLDPTLVITPATGFVGASAPTLWWSEAGNDFGCAPATGHNLDIFLPQLTDLTLTGDQKVIVEFNSLWNIEWDYDYGFVMYTTDGDTYTAMPSLNNYTTPAAQNPNANGCQTTYGNGLTGTTASYQAGTQAVDRVAGNYDYSGGFLVDRYDMSAAAGSEDVALRFSYSTDPGFTAPGWFIDDVVVKIEETGQPDVILYQSNFDDAQEDQVFNGGCKAETCVASTPTAGWTFVSIESGSPADKGYYLEMRDRSGFDFDGNGENDRGPLDWSPGLYMMFTDEIHGYGNTGADNQPAQTPVDANPVAGDETPDLSDAAFTDGGVTTYSDKGSGWTDNYDDGSGSWIHAFECMEFTVNSMSGEETGGGAGGSNAVPGDLTGNVTFTMGNSCADFSYHVCTAPTAVNSVDITNLPSDEVQLSWGGEADAYEIWWEVNDPYFTPGTDCGAASNCAATTGGDFTHSPGGVGNAMSNFYYIVVGANACGAQVGDASNNHTAEFDFALEPGSN